MSQPVPGWYPDPAGSPRLRWWNGGIWTDQYLPHARHSASAGHARRHAWGTSAVQRRHAAGCPPGPGRILPPGNAHPARHELTPRSFLPAGTEGSLQSLSEHRHHADLLRLRELSERGRRRAGNKPRTGSGWFIGLVAAWIAVVLFAASAVYAGMAFTRASKELADAESEHASAQSEYNEAQSGLDKAKKDLEETQK